MVQQRMEAELMLYNSFKYISCYGSTWMQKQETKSTAVFKYISCYGSTCLET